MAVQFCDNCNEPIGEGHIFDFDSHFNYYCDVKCLTAAIKKFGYEQLYNMSLDEMYDEAIQYYTTWYDDNDYNVTRVYLYKNEWYADMPTTDNTIVENWLLYNETTLNLWEKSDNENLYRLTKKPLQLDVKNIYESLDGVKKAYYEQC